MKIHTIYQPKHRKPYIARWYEVPSSAKATDGKPRQRNRFFATESSRADLIEEFQKLSERQDPTLHELAPHQLIRWQQAMAIVPGADLLKISRKSTELDSRETCLTSITRRRRNQKNR